MNPEVSILTTSKNYGDYIEDCIVSVIAQREWHNAKINHIVMDGGSWDDTLKTLVNYSDYVYFDIDKDKTQTQALNKGMKLIEDEFPDTTHIGWINADDFYKPYWLDEVYKQLRKEPDDVALVCSDIVLYGGRGGRTTWGIQNYFDKLFFAKLGNTVSQPSVLIRFNKFKELKDKYGYYFNPDYEYCQDLDLWYRFLDSGYRIRHIGRLTANLRLHERQMSNTKRREQIVERDKIIGHICAETGAPLPRWYGE